MPVLCVCGDFWSYRGLATYRPNRAATVSASRAARLVRQRIATALYPARHVFRDRARLLRRQCADLADGGAPRAAFGCPVLVHKHRAPLGSINSPKPGKVVSQTKMGFVPGRAASTIRFEIRAMNRPRVLAYTAAV